RMRTVSSFIGFDNKPVELHHLKQTHEGPIAENGSKDHFIYTSVIHAPSNTHHSLIDREKFPKRREDYWKGLAEGYGEEVNSNLGGIIDMKWGIIGLNFDRWGQEHVQ
ncbi:HNH/ENDO VII family nuclease, partial [Bartonella taylorii]|uniref:HNH/ENDO VII family nuclease n=1 Tax=Bartonella taylorii TaxID=33046 RepID=UPI001FEF1B8C